MDRLFAVLLAKQTQLKFLEVSYPEWDIDNVYMRDIAFASLSEFLLQQRSLECLDLFLCGISMSTVMNCVRNNKATLNDIQLDLRTDPDKEGSAGMVPSLSDMEALASCSCLKTLDLYISIEDLDVVSLSSINFNVRSEAPYTQSPVTQNSQHIMLTLGLTVDLILPTCYQNIPHPH